MEWLPLAVATSFGSISCKGRKEKHWQSQWHPAKPRPVVAGNELAAESLSFDRHGLQAG